MSFIFYILSKVHSKDEDNRKISKNTIPFSFLSFLFFEKDTLTFHQGNEKRLMLQSTKKPIKEKLQTTQNYIHLKLNHNKLLTPK